MIQKPKGTKDVLAEDVFKWKTGVWKMSDTWMLFG